jgi:hypothetical protein
MIEGPVFGNQDQWKGLGLFFDSFDNDNLVRDQLFSDVN